MRLVQCTLSTSTCDTYDGLEEEKQAGARNKFRSWIKKRLGGENLPDNTEKLKEILYRVAASSSSAGGGSLISVDYVTDVYAKEIKRQIAEKIEERTGHVCQSKGVRTDPKKRRDLSGLLRHRPIGWMKGSIMDIDEDFDISLLFGDIGTLKMRYDLQHGTNSSKNIPECSFRSELTFQECSIRSEQTFWNDPSDFLTTRWYFSNQLTNQF